MGAAVFLLTLLAFLPALYAGFVNWDDEVALLQNPAFRGLGWAQVKWAFTTGLLGHWQPLAWLTYSLDHALWGLKPFGYHLTNVLLHCLNSVLLYKLGRTLDLSRRRAAAAALLWSLHPLRVESVAWATERRDLLSASFFLGGLLAARPFPFYIGALLSKITTVTFPFGLWVLRRQWRPWYFIAALPVVALGFWAQAQSGSLVPLSETGPGQRLAQAFYGVGFYLWKTVWPFGLSPWYEQARFAWPLALVGLLALAFARRRAMAFYLLTLLPMLGLVKSGRQLVADRYSYIPTMALALAAPPAAAVVLPGLVWLTWRQCGVWKDSVSLWSRVAELNPGSYFPLANKALALQQQGRVEESLAELRQLGEEAHPQARQLIAVAEHNAALLLLEKGQALEAARLLRRAVPHLPRRDAALVNLGAALQRAGHRGEARRAYEEALALNPSNADAARALKSLQR